MSEKIEIENNKHNTNNNEFNVNGNHYLGSVNPKNFQLDFNFDILNEPLPDFIINKKKNENCFLNSKNYAYRRRYNEIKT